MSSVGEFLGDLAFAGNILALIGCFIIIISHYIQQRGSRGPVSVGGGHVTVHRRALLLMSITNVVSNVGGLAYNNMDWANNPQVCWLQGYHITWFNLSNWFWNMCVSINILLILMRVDFHPQRLIYGMAAVCWGFPSILTIPFIVNPSYITPLTAWCWVEPTEQAARYGMFYGWLFVTVTVNLAVLILIIVTTVTNSSRSIRSRPTTRTAIGSTSAMAPRSRRSSTQNSPYQTLVRRYVAYVFVLLFCWIWGASIRFIELTTNPRFFDLGLYSMHTFFSISQMLWISLVLVAAPALESIGSRIRKSLDVLGSRDVGSASAFTGRKEGAPSADAETPAVNGNTEVHRSAAPAGPDAV